MCKLCSKAVQDVTFVLHVVHYHPSDATGIEIKQTFVTKLISKKLSLRTVTGTIWKGCKKRHLGHTKLVHNLGHTVFIRL